MSKRALKILILSHSSELSGAERSMVDLFDYWSKKGLIEPYFIIRKPTKNLANELRKRGWKYTALYYTSWSDREPSKKAESIYRNALLNSKAVFRIEKLILKIQPDAVFTNTIIAPWAALAAHFQRIPHVWFVREYGDIDHGHFFEIGREKTMQDIDTLSNLVVTNSRTLAKHTAQYIDNEKVSPLYTPFNLDYLRKKSQEEAVNPFKNKDSLKLAITGKIAHSKGQAEAALAVSKIINMGFDAELCVIGRPIEPQDIRTLKEVINKNKLQNKVHLLGHQANPLAILKYADVGIMASKQEAFGRVTFEYMALGMPVVGSNTGATPEMINNDYNGYLYQQGSVNSLAEQLSKYAKSRSLIGAHGEHARVRATEIINSQYGADDVFMKILQAVEKKEQCTTRPLHITHRWLEYPGIMLAVTKAYDKRIDDYRHDIRNIVDSKAWKMILLIRKVLRK